MLMSELKLNLVYRRNYDNIDNLGVVNVEPTGPDSTGYYYPIALEMLDKLESEGVLVPMRHPSKKQIQLEQQLNRIKNLTIGNSRIWALDRLAMELEVEADMIQETHDGSDTHMEGAEEHVSKRVSDLRADALFLRRLEWDLRELHTAVHGDKDRSGKYDDKNWRGERP